MFAHSNKAKDALSEWLNKIGGKKSNVETFQSLTALFDAIRDQNIEAILGCLRVFNCLLSPGNYSNIPVKQSNLLNE